MGCLIWGQLNNTITTCLEAERGSKYSRSSSSMSKPSPLFINHLCLASDVSPSPPLLLLSAVKTWPFPHCSSLTPTQDLSHCCFHDNTNAETAGWDAQQEEANGYWSWEGGGAVLHIMNTLYVASDGQITQYSMITTKLSEKALCFFWPPITYLKSMVVKSL